MIEIKTIDSDRRRSSEVAPGPWHRSTSTALEIRGGLGSAVEVGGYATRYGVEYEVGGGPANFGWIESVAPGAGAASLAEDPDVVLLVNHEGMPLARTKSGTLHLAEDEHGLYHSTRLDSSDPDVAALLPKLERGDVDEMSFAFRVTDHSWFEHDDHEGDNMSGRRINSYNINRGDVSYVTFGANPNTTIDLRGLDAALASILVEGDTDLDRLDEFELVETRTAIERVRGINRANADGMSDGDGMSPAVIQQRQRLWTLAQREDIT